MPCHLEGKVTNTVYSCTYIIKHNAGHCMMRQPGWLTCASAQADSGMVLAIRSHEMMSYTLCRSWHVKRAIPACTQR